MATVKQCDCCGKVYIPSTKSNDYRFRISDTEPTLHILDLCYDCLAKVEALMGGKKHTPGWKGPVKSRRQTAPHNTPRPETGMENEVTKHDDFIQTANGRVILKDAFKDHPNVPIQVDGLYRPEDAPCCCEVGACGEREPMDAIKVLYPDTGEEEVIYPQSGGTTLGEIYPNLSAQVEEEK